VCERTIIGRVTMTDRIGLIVELRQMIFPGIEDRCLPENASAQGNLESFPQVQAAQAVACRELTKTEICQIIEDHRYSTCALDSI
jgi:hypothetical protein